MAGVLGWDEAQITKEVEHYHRRVAAERESQRKPDDASADAARLAAGDVVATS
jgi:glycerol-3-phosphate dehydrogenase